MGNVWFKSESLDSWGQNGRKKANERVFQEQVIAWIIAVKVVDIFGNDTMKIIEVGV